MQMSSRDTLYVLDALNTIGSIGYRLAGKWKESLSCFCEIYTFTDSLKKRCAEVVLQLLDLLRECTLCDKTLLGGYREVECFGTGDEIFQMSQFHNRFYQ